MVLRNALDGLATEPKQDSEITQLIAAVAHLANVVTALQGTLVTNPSDRPARQLGVVSAASLPLPTGAASQATLQLVQDKLVDIYAAVDGLEVTAGNIEINADTLNLQTDEVEALLQAVRDRLPALLDADLGLKAHIQNFPADIDVRDRAGRLVGHVTVDNFPVTQSVSGTVNIGTIPEVEVKNETGTALAIKGTAVNDKVGTLDTYLGGEPLPDQSSVGAVLTFDFTTPVDLVWVLSRGAVGRADSFGGTPTGSLGVYCDDGVPTPITQHTSQIKIIAASGAVVSVWGFRYEL